MYRWFLLILAQAAASFGLLTVLKTPDWLDWRLAIQAGEFGHRMVLVPLAVVILVGWSGDRSALSVATLALGSAALLLLLKPAEEAWRLGRIVPAQLEQAFGQWQPRQPPFSVARLYRRGPDPVPVETMAYSGGRPLRVSSWCIAVAGAMASGARCPTSTLGSPAAVTRSRPSRIASRPGPSGRRNGTTFSPPWLFCAPTLARWASIPRGWSFLAGRPGGSSWRPPHMRRMIPRSAA